VNVSLGETFTTSSTPQGLRCGRRRAGYEPLMSEPEQPPTDVAPGLPEDGQPGTGMDPREHSENEVDQHGPPHTSTSQDSDASKATGNPKAAGGDSARS
jgi:hypothetical protein